ncbi:MAG: class A beta-lactamase-related serine hydrolase [candidate division KSB1 bacterium]|nr:class A beta-lactamase-related serine hydrolase [candidate division KSB1 bacterium]MDZ7294474.1 class A beta-lactamase-related serine hydrolase [candidate division KSB1 bacterium]MDZ7385248.1 class A beta-lactamase-related serine hydrolase [candidate division KSB1 bacterium]MDZ7393456.1 class A beta-lactamase-related serine hydrolase [candidate division KSB1 bacterium]MDZ7414180.1 class A beta-lactamase-related serine hydrolase [candidate division KSB1 bacterium]
MKRQHARAGRSSTRRATLCLAGVALLSLWAFPSHNSVDTNEIKRLRDDIALKEHDLRGLFAIAYKDLDSGQTFFHNAHELMHAASLMKVPVMVEVFRQAERGHFRLEDSLMVRNRFRSVVDGSPYALRLSEDSDDAIYGAIGRPMAIRELVERMITVSSNLAANLLLELVGPDKVTATMRGLGAPHIYVRRGLEDDKAFAKGINNETTAYDMMVILEAIARGRAASQASCSEMIDIMLRQKLNTKIPALLPDSIKVAHKTGSISGIDHDAGILYFPSGRRCVLVIMSKGIANHNHAAQAIAQLTRAVLDAMGRM